MKPTKFLALLLPLAMATSAANAEWVRLLKSVNGATAYLERGSVHRTGTDVTYWTLLDFPEPMKTSGASLQSIKTQYLVDCAGHRFRPALIEIYAGPMASGAMLATFPSDDPFKTTKSERDDRDKAPMIAELSCAGLLR